MNDKRFFGIALFATFIIWMVGLLILRAFNLDLDKSEVIVAYVSLSNLFSFLVGLVIRDFFDGKVDTA